MNRATRHTLLAFTASLVLTPMAVLHADAPAPQRPVKKLIEYGWDVPYPDQVRKDTCVHGLHYVGDKLGLIARAASWLTEDGQFVANLDFNNLRLADGRPAKWAVGRELRKAGLGYDTRKKLLHCAGPRQLKLPFRYLGADDQAGPNYTKQAAVDSYYARL